MKKIVSIIMMLALILVPSAAAFATTFTSTMSMSAHSTLKGQTRSYTGSTHSLSIDLSSRSDYLNENNYCKATLNRAKLLEDEPQKTVELNLKTVGMDLLHGIKLTEIFITTLTVFTQL